MALTNNGNNHGVVNLTEEMVLGIIIVKLCNKRARDQTEIDFFLVESIVKLNLWGNELVKKIRGERNGKKKEKKRKIG